MQIAILGGTGDIGKGLALRWAIDTDHDIRIGSRKEAKALASVEEYRSVLSEWDTPGNVTGDENACATQGSDVVILAVPPYHVANLVKEISASLRDDAILVSPAVGIKRDDDGFHYHPPKEGSVTKLVADTAPDGVPVVGAFHNLAAERLATITEDLGLDTVVIGNDEAAKRRVMDLAEEINGMRALDGGPTTNAPEVESVTALLITLARYNDGLHDAGVRFV